jgi:C-terminal processing protease CtpA/Prc
MEWPTTITSVTAVLVGALLCGCTEKPKDMVRASLLSHRRDAASFDVRSGGAKSLPTDPGEMDAAGDFGMSITTNFEVGQGGKTEWVLVDDVLDGSSAARVGIRAGDRIMAIDGQVVTEMDGDELCALLFERQEGESIRLLVLRSQRAVLDFVTLVASPNDENRLAPRKGA